MQTSHRFSLATYILTLAKIAMEEEAGVSLTSEKMGSSVNAHPVHVRRVLGALREAGLVTSQPGPGGGWRLARSAESITLFDIYRAVEDEPLLSTPNSLNAECPLGNCLPNVLTTCFHEAEAALEARLAQVTIADVITAARADHDLVRGSAPIAELIPRK
jgi:Rrf2 family protein